MGNYPIMLDLAGKRVAIVGGGSVATRRLRRLLETGAEITVISIAASVEIEDLAAQGVIRYIAAAYKREYVAEAFLVMAATESQIVNERIAEEATDMQIVNVVNAPEKGNAQIPAVHVAGDLTITVATNGASPTLARKIKNEISHTYDHRYIEYLCFLKTTRKYILSHAFLADEDKRYLLAQLTDDLYLYNEAERINILRKINQFKFKDCSIKK